MLCDDFDIETTALIARLTLEDIDEFELAQKGKGRSDVPLSDADLALQAQGESMRDALRMIQDFEFAQSIDCALATDVGCLAAFLVVARAEEDDHRAALALSRGQPLPRQSEAQQAIEGPPPGRLLLEDIPQAPITAETNSVVTITAEASRPPTPSTSSLIRVRHECTICLNQCIASSAFRAPCGHYYCPGCLVDLVEASTRDETLFPLKCCKQPFPVQRVIPYLRSNLKLHSLFRAKSIEFGTPSSRRIYCPNPRCSIFLSPVYDSNSDIICTQCQTEVCPACKSVAHPEACADAASIVEVRTLAQSQQWQTCPGCKNIVELSQGCYHITCRCKTEFCYLCAVRWRNCTCPQWDERHLLDTAEQRVANEFGRRAAAVEPVLHAQRVRERVADLRISHYCAHNTWRSRGGGGNCEECGHFLPLFLKRCTGCQMLACLRCTRNRL